MRDEVEDRFLEVLKLHQAALELLVPLLGRFEELEKRVAFLEEMLLNDRKEAK